MAMKYTVTSFTYGKKGGQVTVTVGEGQNRRSFTRHLQRQGGGALMGLNIDERALPLNARYEAELRTAETEFASAEAARTALEKELKTLEDAVETGMTGDIDVEAAKGLLVNQIEIASDDIADRIDAVDDAEEKLAIVRRELPLMMMFRRS